MPSAEEVVELWQERKRRQEPRFQIMRDFDAAYAGETHLPLPELGRSEKPMVANLLATGLDQTAMRIASTLPDPEFPPMRDTVDTAVKRAQQRHDVVLSWWHMNDLTLKLKERARHLLGYSTAPVLVSYDPAYPYPVWRVLDPFTVFLPPPSPTREMTPLDAICTYEQPLKWLKRIYPGHMDLVYQGHKPSPDDVYTCLQYYGHDEYVLIIMGRSMDPSSPNAWASPAGSGRPWIEVERQPNRTGLCPVVAPNRISLNRNKPLGQFDGLLGVFEWQAKLMALGVIAAERDIFPDLWAISRPNENVLIEEEADGLKGVIGKMSGGSLEMRHNTPGNQHLQLQSILERALRMEGGIPSEFSGEAATNVRTARRGGQILSQAVDFAIQEAQQIFEVSLREENVRAIATDKAYFDGPRAFYFDWKGRKGSGTYDPGETWETDRHTVSYSFAGADANELTVLTGQAIGIGLMSVERGMELHPMIKDPLIEKSRVSVEALEMALRQGMQTMIAQPGGVPITDVARMIELIDEQHMPLHKAMLQTQKEAQERQASSGPPGEPTGPVDPMSPEAQPGIAAPGQGAEAATIAPPQPSMENLQSLLSTLR